MYDWKSSAHTQHGYSFEKRSTNRSISDCCVRDGVSGYVAAMVCSSVHELRPSISTSGGQLDCSLEFVESAVVVDPDMVVVLSPLMFCFACAAHAENAAPEVHDRHLSEANLVDRF